MNTATEVMHYVDSVFEASDQQAKQNDAIADDVMNQMVAADRTIGWAYDDLDGGSDRPRMSGRML